MTVTLPVSNINDVKIYNVSGSSHRTLPDWLERRHARSLKKDPVWSKRIELVQDFGFPTATNRLKLTTDGKFMVGVGTYKPQFRVWELGQSSMKFERHTTCETVAFELLRDDWTMMALLQTDRAIEFHEAKGMRYRTKVPRAPRDIVYDAETSDLLISTAQDVFVLNLELGQFKEPLVTGCGVNTCKVAPKHGLYALGLEGGTVELWDRRDGSKQAALSFPDSGDITALHYLNELTLAVGTEKGTISLLDLRSPRPYFTRDHQNGFAIRGIVSQNQQILSWDKKALKIWNGNASKVISIEPGHDINDVVVQSGFIALAIEDAKVASYLIPSLGPAPSWASYLEHITEEMEETKNSSASTYDNYKFVDKAELIKLGLEHLIGSKLLRAYMHGYFMHLKLYEQAKAVANPFAYEEFLEKQKAEKLVKERASRISAASIGKKPKVNSKLAEKSQTVQEDDRFKALFQDADYEVDEESDAYLAIHSARKQAKSK